MLYQMGPQTLRQTHGSLLQFPSIDYFFFTFYNLLTQCNPASPTQSPLKGKTNNTKAKRENAGLSINCFASKGKSHIDIHIFDI